MYPKIQNLLRNKYNKEIFNKMNSTIEQIKELTEQLSADVNKFYTGNKSAGTRARKSSQDLKNLLQLLRTEILEERKK